MRRPAVPAPVTRRAPELPFHQLDEEGFEAFCHDFVGRLPETASCNRYGVRGNAQYGIDLEARLHSGQRWGFQFKGYRQYDKARARKAIEDTTYVADHFVLLLACRATTTVRQEVAKHPEWEIWDGSDIAQRVLSLPTEDARRLIERHFGAVWRREFLGLRGLMAFRTPEDFYSALLAPDRLFSHAWNLVGREDLLLSLDEFVASADHRVAILPGRGGIGKSRVILEFTRDFASRHPGCTMLIAEGVLVDADACDELPAGPLLIVVEDAHRGAGMDVLLALQKQRRDPTKLLFTTRPSGVGRLHTALSRADVALEAIKPLAELRELDAQQVRQLAAQVLGPDLKHYAQRLADATADCPLVTVIGGRLLAERSVAPEVLERIDEFRAVAFTRFEDEILGQVSERIEPGLARPLLELLSAIGPIEPARADLRTLIAEHLGREVPEIVRAVDVLELAGVLLRSGATVRIVPDVLADHILHSVCVTSNGEPTGYVEQVFQRFSSVCPEALLRNLGELDWRNRALGGKGQDLLKEVWAEIRREFEAAPRTRRVQLLGLLREFALYRPRDMLALVEWAIAHPDAPPEPYPATWFPGMPHEAVLRELPPILRYIAFTRDYTDRALDILWRLGRDDSRRETDQDHPIHVLVDLATLHPQATSTVRDRVVEAVARWLCDPDAHGHLHSPLRLLDPVFEKVATSHSFEGHRVGIGQHLVLVEPTRPLRERALELVRSCATSTDLRGALRALKCLKLAFAYPERGWVGLPDDWLASWIPEQLRAVELLEEAGCSATHPLVPLHVLDIASWHLGKGRSRQIRERVRALVRRLPRCFRFKLVRELALGRDPAWEPRFGRNYQEEKRRHGGRRSAVVATLAAEFRQRWPTPVEALGVLEEELEQIRAAGVTPNPRYFLYRLAVLDLASALEMATLIVQRPRSPMAPYLDSVLDPARRRDPVAARGIAAVATEGGSPELCGSVARLLAHPDWLSDFTTVDQAVGIRILQHPEAGVRAAALDAMAYQVGRHGEGIRRLAAHVSVCGDEEVAKGLCELFHPEMGLPVAELTDQEVETLLNKLDDVEELDEWAVEEFLKGIAGTHARPVVEFLIRRAEKGLTRSFQQRELARPLFDAEGNPAVDLELATELLRGVRDRLVSQERGSRHDLSKLFVDLAPRLPPVALRLLREWIDEPTEERLLGVGTVAGDADADFVFREPAFVAALLERAAALGSECEEQIALELAGGALRGAGFVQRGQMAPRCGVVRDEATQLLAQFRPDSPARKFYTGLVERSDEFLAARPEPDSDDE
jgi:hypothetical protein